MVDLQPVPDTVHLGVRSGLRRSSLGPAVVERLAAPPDVVIGGSLRAPPGTVGLHLSAHSTHDDDCAFLISHEFAHVHADDSAMHLILPDPIKTRAIKVGWAEPHPLAGRSTIPPDTVMLHAPRNDTELQPSPDWPRSRGRTPITESGEIMPSDHEMVTSNNACALPIDHQSDLYFNVGNIGIHALQGNSIALVKILALHRIAAVISCAAQDPLSSMTPLLREVSACFPGVEPIYFTRTNVRLNERIRAQVEAPS